MAIRIPCLSCRSATLADETAASVACGTCNAPLPPPAQAAWSMLRGGAQFGPYTIASLATYLADGRAGPTDEIWYPGAPVRLALGQLPPFGPVPAAGGPSEAPAPAPAEPKPQFTDERTNADTTITVDHKADPAQPVFISHALADGRFAAVFAQDLAHHGLSAWYAARDLESGADYWPQVDRAIEAAGAVVALVSAALDQSPNVHAEVERARRAGKPILALRLSAEPEGHGLGEMIGQVSAFGPDAGAQSATALVLLADIYGVEVNDARPPRFVLGLYYPGEGGKEPAYALPPGPLASYPAPPEAATEAVAEAPEPEPEPVVAPEPESVEAPVAEAPPAPEPAPEAAPEPAPVEAPAPDGTAAAESPAEPEPEPQAEPQPVAAPSPEPAPAEAPAPASPMTEAQPGGTAHIPCLSCRATTIAPENAAAVSCSRCGMVLPSPAEAAWFALRDGTQFGPYRLPDLASYVAEGRIRPEDSIWHQGATVRQQVNQLPPFGIAPPGMDGGGAAPAAAAAPAVPAPVPAPAEPSASSLPADGSDWDSLEVQPGEVVLGKWTIALDTAGVQPGGKLTITDRRLLFKPTIGGRSLVGMAISQTKSFKEANTIVLDRGRITGVHAVRRVLNVYITVNTLDGDIVFNRGPLSADPILAVLKPL